MRGHNLCFDEKIRKIIPILSLLPLLIWSTVPGYWEYRDEFQEDPQSSPRCRSAPDKKE